MEQLVIKIREKMDELDKRMSSHAIAIVEKLDNVIMRYHKDNSIDIVEEVGKHQILEFPSTRGEKVVYRLSSVAYCIREHVNVAYDSSILPAFKIERVYPDGRIFVSHKSIHDVLDWETDNYSEVFNELKSDYNEYLKEKYESKLP